MLDIGHTRIKSINEKHCIHNYCVPTNTSEFLYVPSTSFSICSTQRRISSCTASTWSMRSMRLNQLVVSPWTNASVNSLTRTGAGGGESWLGRRVDAVSVKIESPPTFGTSLSRLSWVAQGSEVVVVLCDAGCWLLVGALVFRLLTVSSVMLAVVLGGGPVWLEHAGSEVEEEVGGCTSDCGWVEMGLVSREVSWLDVHVGVLARIGADPGGVEGFPILCLAAVMTTGLNAEVVLCWRVFFCVRRETVGIAAGRVVGVGVVLTEPEGFCCLGEFGWGTFSLSLTANTDVSCTPNSEVKSGSVLVERSVPSASWGNRAVPEISCSTTWSRDKSRDLGTPAPWAIDDCVGPAKTLILILPVGFWFSRGKNIGSLGPSEILSPFASFPFSWELEATSTPPPVSGSGFTTVDKELELLLVHAGLSIAAAFWVVSGPRVTIGCRAVAR